MRKTITKSQFSVSFNFLVVSLAISIGSKYLVSLYKSFETSPSSSIPNPKTPILIPIYYKFYSH